MSLQVETTPSRQQQQAQTAAPPSPLTPTQAAGQQQQAQPIQQSPVSSSDGTTSLRVPALDDNDLLGLTDAAPIPLIINDVDDDTAPSSSDETPLYNVEGDVKEEEEWQGGALKPLLYGYLRKLGRNGKWQKRFFETDGESLSYYKSEKRTKQLATLDLRKVGNICMSSEDASGCTFHIQVADRPYSLQAENRQKCIDWVISLNRIKEARLQLGGVKLVTPKFSQHQPQPDLLDTTPTSKHVAPRVVLEANRQRTRAIDADDELAWRDAVETEITSQAQPTIAAYETLALGVRHQLATWHKPRNTVYRMKQRIIKWARSIRKLAVDCTTPDRVVLDSHLHPPGHDDYSSDSNPPSKSSTEEERKRTPGLPVNPRFVNVDEDGETRELM